MVKAQMWKRKPITLDTLVSPAISEFIKYMYSKYLSYVTIAGGFPGYIAGAHKQFHDIDIFTYDGASYYIANDLREKFNINFKMDSRSEYIRSENIACIFKGELERQISPSISDDIPIQIIERRGPTVNHDVVDDFHFKNAMYFMSNEKYVFYPVEMESSTKLVFNNLDSLKDCTVSALHHVISKYLDKGFTLDHNEFSKLAMVLPSHNLFWLLDKFKGDSRIETSMFRGVTLNTRNIR